MADNTVRLNVDIATAGAIADLRKLQAEIGRLNAANATSYGASAAKLNEYNKALRDQVNAGRLFTAHQTRMVSDVDLFSRSLDRGKLSLGQYTRFATSQLPGMSRVFRREFDTIQKVAQDRVRKINSQYLELGRNSQGLGKSLAIVPRDAAMAWNSYNAAAATAVQRQMILNKLISDGTTKLLNWGKNTQWAGRQLTVGLTVPLAAFGVQASRIFMQLDREIRDFKRVYGDAFTADAEIERNLAAVQELASAYTKYGIAAQDTLNIASTAAAAGFANNDLLRQTEESLRLATIGQIDYQQALQTTITLQNAFGTSAEDLAEATDYIGAIANQTVLSVDDFTKAIPRVAPIIEGLGGDIKDLGVLLTAMKEGGVSAEQGANALKSGLASLINPTDRAIEALDKMGISLLGIIQANKGDLIGTVQALGKELETLDEFSRQQAIEKIFGKYQFARLSALFNNIGKAGTQAQIAFDLAGKSAEELAALSEKSLGQVAESTTAKFEGAVERLKIAIAPIGEAFLEIFTPLINGISNILEKISNIPSSFKVALIALAAIGPVLTLFGLFGNALANILKGLDFFRKVLTGLRKPGSVFEYITTSELEASAAAAQLSGSVGGVTSALVLQQSAVRQLTKLYQDLALAAGAASASTGGAAASAVARGGGARIRAANGLVLVPGKGNGDTVPALLTPGESVMTKEATRRYGPVLEAMNKGTLPGYQNGNVGAHLTGRQPVTDVRIFEQFEGRVRGTQSSVTQAMQALYREQESIRQFFYRYSGLVANVSKGLNSALNTGTATFAQFQKEFQGGVTAGAIKSAGGDPKLSAQFERAIVERIKAMGTATVSDKQLTQATNAVIKEWRNASQGTQEQIRAQKEFAMAARRAANATAQVALDLSSREGQAALARLRSEGRVTSTTGRGGGEIFRYAPIAPTPGIRGAELGRVSGTSGKFRPPGRTGGLRSIIAGTANILERVTRRTTRTQSPSRVAEDIGEDWDAGLAQGLRRGQKIVQKAATEVGQTAASATGAALTPKQAYQQAQSAARAQARQQANVAQLQAAGYNQTQIDRTMRRLEESRQRSIDNARRRREEQAQMQRDRAREARLRQTDRVQQQQGAGRAGLLGRARNYLTGPVMNKYGEETTRLNKFGGALSKASVGLTGVALAASFVPGPLGEMAQNALPVVFGLTALQGILPLLLTPMGALVGVAGALAAVYVKTRMDLDNLAREAAKAGASLGGFADSFKILEEATGLKAATPGDSLFRFSDEDRKALSEFDDYFQGEGGQAFLSELKNVSQPERYEKVANLLAKGIGAGLDPKKAAEFGKAIAYELGDSLLASSIAKDFAAGVFKSGSEALISLQEKSLANAPTISPSLRRAPVEISGNIVEQGLIVQAQSAETQAAAAEFWADFFSGGEAETPVSDQLYGDIKLATEEASKLAGFLVTQAKDLSVAEATLFDERQKGIITTEEYLSGLSRIDDATQQVVDGWRAIAESDANAGAVLQGIKDVLTISRGFTDEQASAVTERFGSENLSTQFFDKQYKDLNDAQRDFIAQAQANLFENLTPQNYEQKLQDLNTTFTFLAEKWGGELENNTKQGIEDGLNQINLADWLRSNLGATGTGISGIPGEADTLAQNLVSAGPELDAIGQSIQSVQSVLNGFQDEAFARKILRSKDSVLDFGEALNTLSKYEKIDIELVLSENIDPDKLAAQIEAIRKLDLSDVNKDVRKFAVDPQDLINAWVELGVVTDKTVNKIPSLYKNALDKAGGVVDDFKRNKFGLIEVNADIITRLFGKEQASGGALANSLKTAFPKGLDPITLQILVALGGDATALALLKNPKAIAAAQAGDTSFEEYKYVGGTSGVQKVTTNIDPFTAELLKQTGQGVGADIPTSEEPTGSGGSSAKEKSALRLYDEELIKQVKLYGNINATLKMLNGKRAEFVKLTKVGKGIQDQLRQAGYSELFISDVLAEGYDYARQFVKKGVETNKRGKVTGKTTLGRRREKLSAITEGQEYAQSRSDEAEVEARRGEALDYFTNKFPKAVELTKDELRSLGEDDAFVEQVLKLKAAGKDGLNALRDVGRQTVDALVASRNPLDELQKKVEEVDKQFEELREQTEELYRANFEVEYGQSPEAYEDAIRANDKLIEQENRKIEGYQRQIELLDREDEKAQRRIELLNRENELLNRRISVYQHDLDEIGRAEDAINEAYDKKIAALEEVSRINDHLIAQQRQQLSIADALTQGDIAAAAAAQQEAQAENAQYAQDQARSALEAARESAIGGLVNEQGLTRDQIDEKIYQLRQQQYQIDLNIQKIEDEIYSRVAARQGLEDAIYGIQTGALRTLQDQNQAYQDILDKFNEGLTEALNNVTIQGIGTQEAWNRTKTDIDSIDAVLAGWSQDGGTLAKVQGYTNSISAAISQAASDLASLEGRINAAKATIAANNDKKEKKAAGGFIKFATGGVAGSGGGDTVPALLTPGEFVMRKASVDKYGQAMMQALNMGSFSMPNTKTSDMKYSGQMSSSINNRNVYNSDNFNVNVNLNGTNLSADDVANQVMTKIRGLQQQNLRKRNGY